ncbi:MAG: ribose 5-phosphate isomerase B [Paludibacter sp.]|jgi:ribose 5-phosphate isomerase B|nr:ribose 5-phosphate isomerase B [Paludibacter sp.]
MKPISELRIAFCSDHAGYELKLELLEYLKTRGLTDFHDFGAYSAESSDYPDFAHLMATAVADGEYEFGVSCCGTGNGINIVANRHRGVRSALCWNTEIAVLARKHNNANVIAFPARFVSENDAYAILATFLATDFEGGRHQRRIDKID